MITYLMEQAHSMYSLFVQSIYSEHKRLQTTSASIDSSDSSPKSKPERPFKRQHITIETTLSSYPQRKNEPKMIHVRKSVGVQKACVYCFIMFAQSKAAAKNVT